MRRRSAKTGPGGTDTAPAIPPELYPGIGQRFGLFSHDDPRTAEHSGRRHRWTIQIREAGYTPATLKSAAATDPGYQRWLAAQYRDQERST